MLHKKGVSIRMFVVVASFFSLVIPGLLFFYKQRSIPKSKELPYVSVVVCAKNESDNIMNCARSLTIQNYPVDRFEVVFIDDDSSDRTSWFLRNFNSISNVRVFSLRGNTHRKAGALNYALKLLDYTRTSRVLFTDADCEVSPNWIQTMVDHLECYDVIGGQTSVKSNGSLLSKMQRIEWFEAFSHVGLAQQFFRLSPAVMGNNLGIKAKFFQNGIRFREGEWVEDGALVNELKNLGASIYFSADVKVDTLPETTFNAVVKQRRRWFQGVKNLSCSLRLILVVQLFLLPVLFSGLICAFSVVFIVYLARLFALLFLYRGWKVNVSLFEIVAYDGYQLLLKFRFVVDSLFGGPISWK